MGSMLSHPSPLPFTAPNPSPSRVPARTETPAPLAAAPMTAPDESDLGSLGNVLDFLRLIWAIDHGLQKTSKHMENALGVTGPQRFTLRLVGRFPGISPGQLARLMKVHPSTLTGVLARLEGRRLIERQINTVDRRRAHLHLTAQGAVMDAEIEGTVEGIVQKVLSQHSEETVRATREVLDALARELLVGFDGSTT